MSARSPDRAVIRFVDVDGVRLRTSVRSSGPPLLITRLGASLDLAAPTPYSRPRRMRGVARTIEAMLDAVGNSALDRSSGEDGWLAGADQDRATARRDGRPQRRDDDVRRGAEVLGLPAKEGAGGHRGRL